MLIGYQLTLTVEIIQNSVSSRRTLPFLKDVAEASSHKSCFISYDWGCMLGI